MSEFKGLTKNLIWEKWKLMNWILGIDLIALVALLLLRILTEGFDGALTSSDSFAMFTFSLIVVNIVSFIMLARNNERVLTSNNYRLIPTSESKLYFSNILTTFIAAVYLQILETVVGVILYFISNHADFPIGPTMGVSPDWGIFFQALLLMILGPIMVWSGITLIHFLINWISGFLPFGKQKFVMFILYFGITWLALMIFNFTTGNIFRLLYGDGHLIQFNITELSNTLWISSGIIFIWFVVFTVLDIYFLKRWTETSR